jgi:hypothetical protein
MHSEVAISTTSQVWPNLIFAVDLQLLTPFPGDPESAQIQHSLYTQFKIPRWCLLPTGLIAYEGHMFVAPHDPKEYLTAVYGYIGLNAVFNSSTGKYEPALE